MTEKTGIKRRKLSIADDETNNSPPCHFCWSNSNKEEDLGLIHTLKNISCHYFCLLLSSKMVQNGRDKDGILGFLYKDIIEELKKAKRKRCMYCNLFGATIFCCNRSCYKTFHLPCGKRNGASSFFYGTFQSFCNVHRKFQKIPKHILSKRKMLIVKLDRLKLSDFKKNNNHYKIAKKSIKTSSVAIRKSDKFESNDICCICFECTVAYPIEDLLWPSCCKKYSWLHRKCVQKLALSAGEYYIRCPLCNNRDEFVDALYQFGIYIPSRDASWEREKGAYMDLLERPKVCSAESCVCPNGRTYGKSKQWELLICKYCGSEAAHSKCFKSNSYICQNCINFTKTIEHDIIISDDEIDVESIPQSSASNSE